MPDRQPSEKTNIDSVGIAGLPAAPADRVRLESIPIGLLTEDHDLVLDAATRVLQDELGGAAAVTFVLQTIQFFKSCAGTPINLTASRATNRRDGFCHHVVQRETTVLVENAHSSPIAPERFVGAFAIGAYAGTPIFSGPHVVGTLCCVFPTPRRFCANDVAVVEGIAPMVSDRLAAIAEEATAARSTFTPDVDRCLDLLRNLNSFLVAIRPDIRGLVMQVATADVHAMHLATPLLEEIPLLHQMLREGVGELRTALGGACESAIGAIERLVFELRPLSRLTDAYLAGVVPADATLANARLLDAAAHAFGALEIEVNTLRRSLHRLH